MAYKNEYKIITIPISKECDDKISKMLFDLRYKSKTQLQKDIMEAAIEGVYASMYPMKVNNNDNSQERDDIE